LSAIPAILQKPHYVVELGSLDPINPEPTELPLDYYTLQFLNKSISSCSRYTDISLQRYTHT
jgi:hypothetical protein